MSQPRRSPSSSSPVDLDTMLGTMRETLAQYRDTVQASEDEKQQLVDTVRLLREQLAEERRRNNSNDKNKSSGSPSLQNSPQTATRVLPTGSLPRVGRQPSPHARVVTSGNDADQQSQQQGQQEGGGVTTTDDNSNTAATGSRNNSPKPEMPWHSSSPPSAIAGGDTASHHSTSSSKTRASPERLQNELRISNNKMDHMARELQRVHHDYQSEIKRLHRMIAKMEGQVLELSQYSYAVDAHGAASSQMSSAANTPAIRPPIR